MKFYYNNTLVRTSKTHEYTHAVIDTTTGGCKGCRAGKDKAQAIITSEIAWYEKKAKNHEAGKKALESGKTGFYVQDGRHSWYRRFDSKDSVERFNRCIDENRAYIEYIKSNWQVVELEQR